jgi:agmatine deiminase
MIPDWQTNCVYFSDLLHRKYPAVFAALEAILTRSGTAVAAIPKTKDIWCRDFMPIQVDGDTFCRFIYDPDYLRGYDHLKTPAASCRLKTMTDCRNVELVLDGGNVVPAVNKVILTDKIFKENSARSEKEIRRLLEQTLQAECIMIPRPPYDPIGHADGVVRFLNEDTVLVNDSRGREAAYGRRLRSVLRRHRLECVAVPYFVEDHATAGIPSAAGCYINYLRTDKLLILPVFGVARDDAALRRFESLFSGTRIVPLLCAGLARKGGCFNCVSWTIRARRKKAQDH